MSVCINKPKIKTYTVTCESMWKPWSTCICYWLQFQWKMLFSNSKSVQANEKHIWTNECREKESREIEREWNKKIAWFRSFRSDIWVFSSNCIASSLHWVTKTSKIVQRTQRHTHTLAYICIEGNFTEIIFRCFKQYIHSLFLSWLSALAL